MLQYLSDIIIKVFFKIVKDPILLFFYIKVKLKLNRWKDVQKIQDNILKEIISASNHSEFGKTYNLDKVYTYKDYIKYLKIFSYEDLDPFIKKLITREDSLSMYNDGKVVRSFFASSGTTGTPKLLPLTKRYIKVIQNYLITWGTFMFLDHRETIGTKHVLIVSYNQLLDDLNFKNKVLKDIPTSSLSCKDTTGTMADNIPSFIKGGSRVPMFVFEIENQDLKMYLILRFSLITKDVKAIISVSPYNFVALAEALNKYKELLIKDLNDSGLSYPKDEISEGDRKIIEDKKNIKYFKLKNKRISKELSQIISKKKDLYPRDIWKNLSFFAGWIEGNLKPVVDTLKDIYGCSNVRDIGLLSTEGMFSIPIKDNTDEGLLNLESCFYEFIPEENYYRSYLYEEKIYKDVYNNDKEDQNNNENNIEHDKDYIGKDKLDLLDVKRASEIEVGKRYFMIITGFNGLFRYDQKDLIECTGLYNKIPMIRFISKTKWISDITAEKLSSYTVSLAFYNVMKKMNLKYFLLSIRPIAGITAYYELIVEKGAIEGKEEIFRSEFENEICNLNFIYKEHLWCNKLKPMKLVIKPKEFWDFYKKGKPQDRYKHPFIIKN